MVLWRAHGNAQIGLSLLLGELWEGSDASDKNRSEVFQGGAAVSSRQPFKTTYSDANLPPHTLHPSSLFSPGAVVAEVDEEKIKKLLGHTAIFFKAV